MHDQRKQSHQNRGGEAQRPFPGLALDGTPRASDGFGQGGRHDAHGACRASEGDRETGSIGHGRCGCRPRVQRHDLYRLARVQGAGRRGSTAEADISCADAFFSSPRPLVEWDAANPSCKATRRLKTVGFSSPQVGDEMRNCPSNPQGHRAAPHHKQARGRKFERAKVKVISGPAALLKGDGRPGRQAPSVRGQSPAPGNADAPPVDQIDHGRRLFPYSRGGGAKSRGARRRLFGRILPRRGRARRGMAWPGEAWHGKAFCCGASTDRRCQGFAAGGPVGAPAAQRFRPCPAAWGGLLSAAGLAGLGS